MKVLIPNKNSKYTTNLLIQLAWKHEYINTTCVVIVLLYFNWHNFMAYF